MGSSMLYAAMQVTKKEFRFIVSSFTPNAVGKFKVIYKNRVKGHYLNAENVVIDDKNLSNLLNRSINEFENTFKRKLGSIACVLPSDSLQILVGSPTIVMGTQPRLVTKNDIDELHNQAWNQQVPKGFSVLNSQVFAYSLDNKQINEYDILNKVGNRLSSREEVYIIRDDIRKSHENIIKSTKRTVLQSTIDSIALSKLWLTGETADRLNVIVNWDYDKTSVSIFNKQVLLNHKVIEFGVKEMINDISEKIKCKHDIAEKYIFSLVDFSSNFNDSNLLYRKYDTANKQNIALSKYQMKSLIKDEVSKTVGIVDEFIKNELKGHVPSKIFHTGKITNIAGFEKVLTATTNRSNEIITCSNVMGASEIWCNVLTGAGVYLSKVNKRVLTTGTSEYIEKKQQNIFDHLQATAPQPRVQSHGLYSPRVPMHNPALANVRVQNNHNMINFQKPNGYNK